MRCSEMAERAIARIRKSMAGYREDSPDWEALRGLLRLEEERLARLRANPEGDIDLEEV